ncbi:MAG TPA: hypothetical protein VJT84_07990, partial [Gaiellaceae bacterium]|nr:hypothetical protein [Gaiellaceae bacterium]
PAAGDPAAPCGVVDPDDPNCYNDHPFTVPGGTGVDNDQASIQVSWATPTSDWDLRVYRDTNGDGKSAGESALANSEQGTTSSEATSIVQPDLTPGNYVIRVINYAADEPYNGTVTFYGPQPFVAAHQESYTLTCERPAGVIKSTRQLFIKRGQIKKLTGLCK